MSLLVRCHFGRSRSRYTLACKIFRSCQDVGILGQDVGDGQYERAIRESIFFQLQKEARTILCVHSAHSRLRHPRRPSPTTPVRLCLMPFRLLSRHYLKTRLACPLGDLPTQPTSSPRPKEGPATTSPFLLLITVNAHRRRQTRRTISPSCWSTTNSDLGRPLRLKR